MQNPLFLPLVFATLTSLSARGDDFAQQPFLARVERARQIAQRIQVDGNDTDWNGFPARFGGQMLAADPSRQVVSTRVLADSQGLRVCVKTAGAPNRLADSFGFRVDFANPQTPDIEIANNSVEEGCSGLNYYQPGKPSKHLPLRGTQFAIGECVEWFIPWTSLVDALPPEERDRLIGGDARPFVRVFPYGYNRANRSFVSFGPAVACFRVPLTENAADTPLPRDAPSAVEMPLMMEGQCYVVNGGMQGPNGFGDHAFKWCYDLSAMDQTLSPSRYRQSRANSEFYAFGRKLSAPVAGQIIAAQDSIPDHVANLPEAERNKLISNFILLRFDNEVLRFGHNKQGSMVPQLNDHVNVGDPIALVGDTGPSSYAHVHVDVHPVGQPESSQPIVLKNVQVSLNPGGNDYWVRDVQHWPIQEGMFVESRGR